MIGIFYIQILHMIKMSVDYTQVHIKLSNIKEKRTPHTKYILYIKLQFYIVTKARKLFKNIVTLSYKDSTRERKWLQKALQTLLQHKTKFQACRHPFQHLHLKLGGAVILDVFGSPETCSSFAKHSS